MGTGDEADCIVEMYAACQHVLPHLGEATLELAQAIHETCEAGERRLIELGVVADALCAGESPLP